MPITLHAAFVPSALQMLDTARHLVDTAEKWAGENGKSEGEIITARLADDMLPFSYQVKSVAEHSAGAIAATREGLYGPDLNPPPETFAALRDKLADARQALEALDEAELEGWIGRDMRFEFNDFGMDFTADNFLLSFAQPNLYFHAATAYDILRAIGVPVGKRDFLGAVRIKT